MKTGHDVPSTQASDIRLQPSAHEPPTLISFKSSLKVPLQLSGDNWKLRCLSPAYTSFSHFISDPFFPAAFLSVYIYVYTSNQCTFEPCTPRALTFHSNEQALYPLFSSVSTLVCTHGYFYFISVTLHTPSPPAAVHVSVDSADRYYINWGFFLTIFSPTHFFIRLKFSYIN